MIDPKLFNLEKLVATILNSDDRSQNEWLKLATIIPDYMPPHPRPDTKPICVVKCKDSYLRHSKGPRQGYFWDMYGDDFLYPELALIALAQAPVPPSLLSDACWEKQ